MKISRAIIKKIEQEAKKYFKNASGCHDWSHVERVRLNALKIARLEKADRQIVEIAALLHDIARNKEMRERGLICHAEEGSKEAEKILKKLKIDNDVIQNVKHAIMAHRYRNAHSPKTIEAKVLQDADRLDAIGAIGIARDFLFAGHSGSKTLYTGREKILAKSGRDHSYSKDDSAVLEYEIKLKHIKDKMQTAAGKKIAQDRHKFMKDYFARFWQEIKGKK